MKQRLKRIYINSNERMGDLMRKIYFIRHSIRDQTVTDDQSAPLTKQGQLLAQGLVDQFADCPVTAIYSSPYLRAMQTVAPLAASLALPIFPVPAFRERQTIARPDWIAHLENLWLDFSLQAQGEESLAEVQARVVPAYEKILRDIPDNLIIAGHGTALAVLFHAITDGQFTFEDWQKMVMPDCYLATYDHQVLTSFEHIGTK